MLKFNLLLLAIVLTLSAQAQKKTELPDQVKLLNKAYKRNSQKKLIQFFNNWRMELPTISDAELAQMSDTIREAYKVFTGFYHIKKIKNLGGFRNSVQDAYDGVKFLALQNSLVVHTTDRLYWSPAETDSIVVETFNKTANPGYLKKPDLSKKLSYYEINRYGPTSDKLHLDKINDKLIDTIGNFRPIVDTGDKQVVYLSKAYSAILSSFLGPSNVMYAEQQKNIDRDKRHQFVETQIKILKWGGYHLHSEPYVRRITMDQSMKYARVDYEIWTETGEAFLRNDNGNWVLLSARALWMQ